MYKMSQWHPVWVTENHVNPCNSVCMYLIHKARSHTHPKHCLAKKMMKVVFILVSVLMN
jgi:hypothetical protein